MAGATDERAFNDADAMRALDALVAIADRDPRFTQQVLSQLLPSLLQTVAEGGSASGVERGGGSASDAPASIAQTLETLGLLCRLPEVFFETVPLLFVRACELLKKATVGSSSSSSVNRRCA